MPEQALQQYLTAAAALPCAETRPHLQAALHPIAPVWTRLLQPRHLRDRPAPHRHPLPPQLMHLHLHRLCILVAAAVVKVELRVGQRGLRLHRHLHRISGHQALQQLRSLVVGAAAQRRAESRLHQALLPPAPQLQVVLTPAEFAHDVKQAVRRLSLQSPRTLAETSAASYPMRFDRPGIAEPTSAMVPAPRPPLMTACLQQLEAETALKAIVVMPAGPMALATSSCGWLSTTWEGWGAETRAELFAPLIT